MPTEYTSTFNQQMHSVYLPKFVDYEQDGFQINVRNDAHYNLAIYTVPYGNETPLPKPNQHIKWQIYELRSETFIEGYNAEIGTSVVTLEWLDLTTRQSVTSNFTLNIISESAY